MGDVYATIFSLY